MAGWTESLHPRVPTGNAGGGRFASAQAGGGGPMKAAGKSGKAVGNPGWVAAKAQMKAAQGKPVGNPGWVAAKAAAKAQHHQNQAQKVKAEMRTLGKQIRAAQKAALAQDRKTAHMGPLPVKPITGSVSGGNMGSKGVSMTIPKPKKAAKGAKAAKSKAGKTGIGLPIVTGTTTSVTPSNTITPPPLAPGASLPVMQQRMAFLQQQHAAHMSRAQAYQRLAAGRGSFGRGPAHLAGDQPAIELGGTVKTPAPRRAAGRKKLAKAHDALSDGSFPIPTVDYLRKAIRSVGRAPASKRPALKALIRKRAKALGAANAPGVKGTWAFQGGNDDSEALEMAMPRKMPMVRGAADVQCSRVSPGGVNVMHKSTGMRVGTLTSKGGSWTGTHSTGKMTAPSPTMPGALSALIAMHNGLVGKKADAGGAPKVKAMAGTPAVPVDLAGALPYTSAATSTDGPRVTTMGGAGKVKAIPPVKLSMGLAPEAVKVYKKLRKRGMSHAQALPMAKRAAAMHAKAQKAA